MSNCGSAIIRVRNDALSRSSFSEASLARRAALRAAEAALDALATLRDGHRPAFEVGVALHVGEVAYGNIGGGGKDPIKIDADRLDVFDRENKAVFAGHSMGGRLITEYAARQPDRVLAVILLDAIVGEPWDRIVALSRFNPFLLAGVGAVLLADSISTMPFLKDPRQAIKFGRLVAPANVDAS